LSSPRLLVISDVHANLPALEAVLREPHDGLLCLGDIVDYGPHPAACLRRIQDEGAATVMGNHDRAAADGSDPGCRPEFRWLADAVLPFTRAQLTEDDRRYLGALPHWIAGPDPAADWLCVHATPVNTLYKYVGPDPEAWARELEGSSADRFLVGHTHLQFDLPVGNRRVVNPGSVGQPKDGDPRAAYAVIERDRIELKRAEYPVEHTVRALDESGIAPDAVRVLSAILRTGRTPAVAP